MAKVGRNQPCPCGSTKKAKRCCYGSGRTIDVRIMPLDMTEEAFTLLRHTDVAEMRRQFDRLADLPDTDLSLQVPLPGIITPALDQAITALRQDDVDEFDRILPQIVETLDSVERRIDLARAVLSLRDEGRVSPVLAAIAVAELDREESIFFTSAVAESISVVAGERRTPGGLLVAAR